MKNNSSIHASYSERREGKESSHLIIALFDCLFQRTEKAFVSSYLYIVCIIGILCNIIVLGNGGEFQLYVLFVCFLLSLINPFAHIYRHFRHKYLKQHNLPGPYGWGTIDANYNAFLICWQLDNDQEAGHNSGNREKMPRTPSSTSARHEVSRAVSEETRKKTNIRNGKQSEKAIQHRPSINLETEEISWLRAEISRLEEYIRLEKKSREAAQHSLYLEKKRADLAERQLLEVQQRVDNAELQLRKEKQRADLAEQQLQQVKQRADLAEQDASYWKSFEDKRIAEKEAKKAAKLEATRKEKEEAERIAAERRAKQDELERLRAIHNNRIKLNSRVYILDRKTNNTKTITLVSSEDADIRYNKISITSPIGKALLNHVIGDVVEIKTPNGVQSLLIQDVY